MEGRAQGLGRTRGRAKEFVMGYLKDPIDIEFIDFAGVGRFLRRRDRLSVYVSILEALDGMRYTKITHVMYRSNLSAVRLRERLLELSYLGLIEWNEQGVRLTEKGAEFLEDVKRLLEKLEKYGIKL